MLPKFILNNLSPLPAYILHDYQNGNVHVQLFSDGTRHLEFPDHEEMKPEFPLNADIKITNKCTSVYEIRDGKEYLNPICSWCHEKSGPQGEHANLDELWNILSVLPKGCELALGGGATLTHPQLIPFLLKLKEHGLVANVTTNQKHVAQDTALILDLFKRDLIKGLGISYSDPFYLESFKPILQASQNVVFHCILGINNISDLAELHEFCKNQNRMTKVLLLGYKQFGFGLNYYAKKKEIEENKYEWFTNVHEWFKKENVILSFDNLAIEQLKLQRFFTEDAWVKFYQGNEGNVSMYCDGVKQEFAKSSTSKERVSFSSVDLKTFFHDLKNSKGCEVSST